MFLLGILASFFCLVISPDEVFGDNNIIFASPPRPPVHPDDVTALKLKSIQRISSNFIGG